MANKNTIERIAEDYDLFFKFGWVPTAALCVVGYLIVVWGMAFEIDPPKKLLAVLLTIGILWGGTVFVWINFLRK